MQDAIIQVLITAMQPKTTLTIRQAVLPAGEGISIEPGASNMVTTYLNRSTGEQVSCVLNAKTRDLQTGRDALSTLHHFLSRMAAYPQTDDWQITAIETIGGPTVIGREPGGLWTIGSTIRVKYYDKRSV